MPIFTTCDHCDRDVLCDIRDGLYLCRECEALPEPKLWPAIVAFSVAALAYVGFLVWNMVR